MDVFILREFYHPSLSRNGQNKETTNMITDMGLRHFATTTFARSSDSFPITLRMGTCFLYVAQFFHFRGLVERVRLGLQFSSTPDGITAIPFSSSLGIASCSIGAQV